MKDEQIFVQAKQVWEDNLKLFPYTELHYPDENLVRLFCGRYVSVPQPSAKVMDHGFGTANTLEFLIGRGYECAGCEISEYFIAEARKRLGKIDLRLVRGVEIPFDNESFDIVVSWNVIHYNGSRAAVMKVISELRRVLKSGGILLLSTIHPDSSLFSRMRRLLDGSYIIEKESQYDNRQGMTLFVARTVEEVAGLFSVFSEVKIGSASADLFNSKKRNAWFLVYAIK